jgi:hypothetical protein
MTSSQHVYEIRPPKEMNRLIRSIGIALAIVACAALGARRALKASLKLVHQRWAKSDRIKHSTASIHIYEIRPRADKRGFDLSSDVLLLGPLWYPGPNGVANAIEYAKFRSRSHDAVICVYDEAGKVIETHEQAGEFKEW